MKNYLIGIDIGTSGTKSVLFDTDGSIAAKASAEYRLYQPQPSWAEENPDDWWEACKKTLREITPFAKGGKIIGIGLSGQMHSLVMLDSDGKVIRPAILWCDSRTEAECKEIEKLIGKERLIEITANPALCGFTASKIMWIKRHEPQNFAKCKAILLPKDYIRYKLSGVLATEVSDASGMQLMDVKHRVWSSEVCEKLGIPTQLLAKLYESSEITAYTSDSILDETGLGGGIAIAGGAGDNAAAAIGMGVCHDGDAFTTIGTSGVVFVHTDNPKIDTLGRIHTFCAAVPNAWHVMGVTQAAALSLSWFKKSFLQDIPYKELDAECERLPIGCHGLMYLPYLMGERTPILDPLARGAFIGLTASHTKYHMARAVIEGVTYSLCDCLDVIKENNISPNFMALCGGGGKSNFWRQMISDAYGSEISIPSSDEGAASGAAILAAVAAGAYDSVPNACEVFCKSSRKISPDMQAHGKYQKYHALYKELYPSLKNHYSLLSETEGSTK